MPLVSAERLGSFFGNAARAVVPKKMRLSFLKAMTGSAARVASFSLNHFTREKNRLDVYKSFIASVKQSAGKEAEPYADLLEQKMRSRVSITIATAKNSIGRLP